MVFKRPQYNIPIEAGRDMPSILGRIQKCEILYDQHGNLNQVAFSRESRPYVVGGVEVMPDYSAGEVRNDVVVIKTLRKEVADFAQRFLKELKEAGLESLVVLPTTVCEWEQPKAKPEPARTAC